jgi:tRNA(Ile)-lysidine synthase
MTDTENPVENAVMRFVHDLGDRRILMAYSGGIDSTVLLHALSRIVSPAQLVALHVDHSLNNNSSIWANHCAQVCQQLGIMIHTTVQNCSMKAGEQEARDLRYRWFTKQVKVNDVLVTAHHRDDQVETIIYRLTRGSGLRGLVGIREKRSYGQGDLVRPLLTVSRSEIYAYARSNNLVWITDPTNVDCSFDRNFIRHKLLHNIEERWPSSRTSIYRTAEHLRQTLSLLDEIANDDYEAIWEEASNCRLGNHGRMNIDKLANLTEARRENLLRSWLDREGYRAPRSKQMDELWRQSQVAAQERTVLLQWKDAQFRRYQNCIYLLPQQSTEFQPEAVTWRPETRKSFAALNVELSLNKRCNGPLRIRTAACDLIELKWSRGQALLKPTGCQYRKHVRKLCQELHVPPWERWRLPLMYRAQLLIGMPGVCIADEFAARPGEPGFVVEIEDLNLRQLSPWKR